jgi:hypothetical protein
MFLLQFSIHGSNLTSQGKSSKKFMHNLSIVSVSVVLLICFDHSTVQRFGVDCLKHDGNGCFSMHDERVI